MDTSKYQNQIEYPERPQKPVLPKGATSSCIRKHADAVEKYEKAMMDYETSKINYQQEESRMMQQFRDDALEELGLTNHPKAGLLYSKAWSMGHSAGLHEVWQYMEDLAELLQ